ncbi:MAG: nicotinamide riboside transporter PnuC [Saprospiraceae bacterium]
MESVTLINEIWKTAIEMGLLQWLAFVLSIIYVILAAKENPLCWPIGLVSVIITFVVYVDPAVRLYSEATLQVYYMVMSVYGWMVWTKSKGENAESKNTVPIRYWSVKEHGAAIAVGLALLFLLGSFWSWMGGALPYVDAFTTSFSIIATYMVTQKIIENWIYFIVVDLISIFMNWERGLYLFALLFAIYCIIAVFGYIAWRKKMEVS